MWAVLFMLSVSLQRPCWTLGCYISQFPPSRCHNATIADPTNNKVSTPTTRPMNSKYRIRHSVVDVLRARWLHAIAVAWLSRVLPPTPNTSSAMEKWLLWHFNLYHEHLSSSTSPMYGRVSVEIHLKGKVTSKQFIYQTYYWYILAETGTKNCCMMQHKASLKGPRMVNQSLCAIT